MTSPRPTLAGLVLLGTALLAGCAAGDPAASSAAPAAGASASASSAPAGDASGSAPAPGEVAPLARAVAPDAAGAVVVLDAGHNGGNAAAPEVIGAPVPAGGFTKPCNTTGTATDAGYPEHAFTYDVVARAAELLRARGVAVVLTRGSDDGFGPCVDARAAVANDAGAALAVSVHADGADAGVRGFHVVEPALAPDGGNAAVLGASAAAATDLRAAFSAATGEPPATYPGALVEPGLTRRSDLAGLNLARTPAVLVECANMRNATDAAAVSDPAWRQRAARGVADGVLAYLGRAS